MTESEGLFGLSLEMWGSGGGWIIQFSPPSLPNGKLLFPNIHGFTRWVDVSCAVTGSCTAPNTPYVTVLQGRNTQSTFRGNRDGKFHRQLNKKQANWKWLLVWKTILTDFWLLSSHSCWACCPLHVARACCMLVCLNSVVDLLIGSAAKKSQCPRRCILRQFNSTTIAENINIHVSVRQGVKSILLSPQLPPGRGRHVGSHFVRSIWRRPCQRSHFIY